MKVLALSLCVLVGAALGVIAGSDRDRTHRAWGEVSAAADELSRLDQLRARLSHLTSELQSVRRELDAASTRDAATAAQAKLFELRVDIVAVEDELSQLARRRPVAGDFGQSP